MEEILEVKNLTKIFKDNPSEVFKAVDDVSFKLYQGEILGIVGESGSGKSTLARLITRITDASEGEIYLFGEDITHIRGSKLNKIYKRFQMVFQSPLDSFDPKKTLGYSIGESLKNEGKPKEDIERVTGELLQSCGLTKDYAKKYPHEVSGGECQRAAIARALAIEPEFLICDEATSSLDVTVQAQIINLLRDIQSRRKMTYLFICHDIALVQDFCTRVLVMHDGKIVEEGRPDEVIMHPKEDYTKKLIDSVL